MSYAFEEAVIRHCAATLAGHKCGSLFCSAQCTEADIQEANALMNPKGVRVESLKSCGCGTLVYVYRPAALNARLNEREIRTFLNSCGYDGETDCISHLKSRIQLESFPHEIGVFLDYPLEDVIAFIENKGEHCPLVGCWKAYTDPESALKTFALYRKCRDVYLRCFARGIGVNRLTVAGCGVTRANA